MITVKRRSYSISATCYASISSESNIRWIIGIITRGFYTNANHCVSTSNLGSVKDALPWSFDLFILQDYLTLVYKYERDVLTLKILKSAGTISPVLTIIASPRTTLSASMFITIPLLFTLANWGAQLLNTCMSVCFAIQGIKQHKKFGQLDGGGITFKPCFCRASFDLWWVNPLSVVLIPCKNFTFEHECTVLLLNCVINGLSSRSVMLK